MLSLLLVVTLLTIAAATAASSLAFTIRRDREEELIHRGAEYSRAIRRYTKKMGRYPLRIEDLENTDGLRFLRKRYKDPITGKDFKLLHMTDLQRVGVGGLSAPATTSASAPENFPANALRGQAPPAQPATPDPQLVSAAAQADLSTSYPAATTENGPNEPGQNPAAQPPASLPQPISGGVIVGVASASRRETIREFNRKNHYSDWLFFYDPAYDRGFEIKGPTQLTAPGANLAQRQPATSEPTTQ
jgi:type II secretory pathway pseudopilin PulG